MMYLLNSNDHNPQFDGVTFVDNAPIIGNIDLLDDFLPNDCITNGLNWTSPSLAKVWSPRQVKGNSKSHHDFPHMFMVPVLSKAAVALLGDLLKDRCELLPLISEFGELFALNVQAKVDLLDVKRSKIVWSDPAQRTFADVIEEYAVDERLLRVNPIFRIPQFISSVFINQDFVDRVQASELRGFIASRVYPAPNSSQQLHRNLSQSVVLRISFPAATLKRTAIKTLKGLERELEEILSHGESEYLGSFEESEFSGVEGRIYLSCPDRNRLGNVIKAWAKNSRINGEVEMVLRKGHYENSNAREKSVRLK